MILDYTLAVTSCDRHDLLTQTLDSFYSLVDILPIKTILVEDGSTVPERTMLHKHSMVRNEQRLGQLKSCDRLMGMVETEWVFWCEDDWLFKEGNFIGPSHEILEGHPEIWSVSLRGRTWAHPLVEDPRFPFLIAQPNWNGGWGGFMFNPGLRRLSDYKKLGSYAQHVEGIQKNGCMAEFRLSQIQLGEGRRIADLGRPIIEHIGQGRSRAIEKL